MKSSKCEAASQKGESGPFSNFTYSNIWCAPCRAKAAKASLVSDPQHSPSHLLDSDLNNNQLVFESKGGVKFLNHLILTISSATMALKNYGHLSSGSGSKSGLS